MRRRLTLPRLVAGSLLVVLLAAYSVPRISAERFREPIRAALESALGRKVTIGEVNFSILPVPGFTLKNVYIGDDPAIGAEPTAYVNTLRGRPAFSTLLGGPLTFASVDLEDASVNLTRAERETGGVSWNFTSFTHSKLPASFPSVHMTRGRVNFKFGETKSVFYLLHTDIDLWPPARAGAPWALALRAEPARTDRPARGFGWFVARGQWRPRDNAITVDVKLEKSELGDMMTLFEGHESGLHGHIWGDAHLAGPATRVGIAGRLTVDDVHGWNQTPPGGNRWPISLGGAVDTQGQIIELRATTGQQAPIDLRYRVTDYLGRPRWAVTAIFSKLPVSPILGLARNLGLSVPGDLALDGTAQGAVGYSMPEGEPRMDGAVRIDSAVLSLPGTPPLRIPVADLRFAGSAITLNPAAMTNDTNETATIEASYDTASQLFDASVSSEGMSIASLRRQISLAGAPLLSNASAGVWSGALRYSNQPPLWSGEVHLKNTDIPFEGFAEPLHLITADATLDGAGLAMKRLNFVVGSIEGQGEYRYQPAAIRPHRFRIAIPRAAAPAIEKVLMPALHRGNLLNYALNLGRVPVPGWMNTMHADGTIQIGALELAGTSFTRLKSRVLWDGDQVRFAGLEGEANDSTFSGVGEVSLAQRDPRYEIAGKVSHLPWRTGTVDAEAAIETEGIGIDLLRNISAKGSFRARDLELTPPDVYDAVAGCFEWEWDARNPKLKLTQLVINSGGDTYLGSAEMQDSGQLVLRVSDGTKQIQASGALLRGDGLKLTGQ